MRKYRAFGGITKLIAMKYKAKKLTNGQFAVFSGKKYFTRSVTDNELEAQQQAILDSMLWYKGRSDEAWEELKKISEVDELGDCVKPIGWDDFCEKKDFLC